MNIAFPALFVFVLALPGIILRSSYREWAWECPVYPVPLGDAIARSLFGAAVLHAIWCGFAEFFGFRVNFEDVLLVLTGGFGLPNTELSTRLHTMIKHPVAIGIYFLSLYVGAAGLGLLGHVLVRHFRLDHKYEALRFDNFWYYVISGEFPYFAENISSYPHLKDAPRPIIFFSCVVTHGSRSFLYYGFPIKHYYDRFTGQLDRIHLKHVTYEELFSPREEAKRARAARKAAAAGELDSPSLFLPQLPIIADFFILNRSDFHNLSVQYINISSTKKLEPVVPKMTASVPKTAPPPPGRDAALATELASSTADEPARSDSVSVQKAAEDGQAWAQNELGLAYQNGAGVPKNSTKAAEWFRKAADQGDPSAQNNLAGAYETGSGLPPNLDRAMDLYKKAAAQGSVYAQENLRRLGK